MSMKMMNAAYLVDNAALLSLQEKQDGVEFHCFDMDSKVQIAEGHIGWDVLDKQPFSTLEESARMAALQQILRLDGLAVAPVASEMLEPVSYTHLWRAMATLSAGVWGIWWNFPSRKPMMRSMLSGGMMIFRFCRNTGSIRYLSARKSSSES